MPTASASTRLGNRDVSASGCDTVCEKEVSFYYKKDISSLWVIKSGASSKETY